jgi:hypothetical protein
MKIESYVLVDSYLRIRNVIFPIVRRVAIDPTASCIIILRKQEAMLHCRIARSQYKPHICIANSVGSTACHPGTTPIKATATITG